MSKCVAINIATILLCRFWLAFARISLRVAVVVLGFVSGVLTKRTKHIYNDIDQITINFFQVVILDNALIENKLLTYYIYTTKFPNRRSCSRHLAKVPPARLITSFFPKSIL